MNPWFCPICRAETVQAHGPRYFTRTCLKCGTDFTHMQQRHARANAEREAAGVVPVPTAPPRIRKQPPRKANRAAA